MTDTKSEARCSNAQGSGIILADTEDWLRPLCHSCWVDFGMPEREPREQLYPTAHAYEQVCKVLNELKAKHERVLQMLEAASKRSSYQWSEGPDYFPSDYANEGRVALALEILAQIESLK